LELPVDGEIKMYIWLQSSTHDLYISWKQEYDVGAECIFENFDLPTVVEHLSRSWQ